MDLFSAAAEQEQQKTAPLAYRMRPQKLSDVVGQQHILASDSLLHRAIQADRLVSLILFGPPGSGKTTLAEVIARTTKARFETLNAVSAGIAEIRLVVNRAKEERDLHGRKTVLFIDEIHRFNKGQQDALLPFVEQGLLTLIGATTENPYFQVNPALVSRSHVFRLLPLGPEDIRILLRRAIADETHGLGEMGLDLTLTAEQVLVEFASGDARRALNALELAAFTSPLNELGRVVIDEQQARESISQRQVLYDRSGDEHYDTISAFIKSVRGSDADAALLWLAKMLTAGEDPLFIGRRLMILAAEDVGNADAQALSVAVAGYQAVATVGMPEARIVLAQVTTYLACAAKSNAVYRAINEALEDVQSGIFLGVPPHLRSTGYRGAAKLGSGVGYLYPHDYPGHLVEQNYWPQAVPSKKYYQPED
ncbi:replication-associated recombination protein A [Alicyclobacillaceae bacterium I2511]|nr:replication-associated recombination protein A [Alicyclobacillaceae bacterium I2511]